MATAAIDELGAQSGGLEAANFPQLLDQCLTSAVISADAHGRINAFSPQAEIFLGLLRSQALGQPVDVLPAPLPELLQKTLSTGELVTDRHFLIVGAEGKPSPVRLAITPVLSGDLKSRGAVAVLNDVTSARELDQHLRRLDRLASIGTLSASMAHEVKNAMVAVKTFVDLLIKKNQDMALADIVGREMRRIDSIVSQMLRFAGPAKPTFAPIRVHEILEQSLNLVQHHLEGRKVKLVRSFHATPDRVHGDAYQLEQAFINLLFNAIEAMGPNGEIEVRTEIVPPGGPENPKAPLLRVTVRDNGVGIPPENIDRLFEPFFTTKSSGTGLGLPITRRIVQEHRGVISVASQPNEGTTFTILLPSAARQP